MTKKIQYRDYLYQGAGFPVKLIGFPFRTLADEEVLDVDLDQLDRAIAKLVLLKPALLTGREIKFLRHILVETLSQFAEHFQMSAAGVKKWEDLSNKPISSIVNDFAIRNYIAQRLSFLDGQPANFAFHKELIEAGEQWNWKPNQIEIPFAAMAKYVGENRPNR